jgi:hypothetical protein
MEAALSVAARVAEPHPRSEEEGPSAMSQEVRRVKTATEFQAAVDTGEVVEFEIAYAYVLRSDRPIPAEFLKKRLKNMLQEERYWAQRGRGVSAETQQEPRE